MNLVYTCDFFILSHPEVETNKEIGNGIYFELGNGTQLYIIIRMCVITTVHLIVAYFVSMHNITCRRLAIL